MTLTARIYLLVALAVMPAFALLAFDHYRGLRYQETEVEQHALRSTSLVSAELDQVFRGFQSLMSAAAQTPMVSNYQTPDCTEYLERLEQVSVGVDWIIAADNRGTVRCGRSRVTVADQNHFVAALKTDELVIGTYSTGSASKIPILPLAIRIQTAEGPGVLVAGVRLDWIRELFAERFSQLPPKSSLTIVDRNGIILVRLPNFDREGKPLVNYEHVAAAPQPGTFRSTAEKNADGIARFLGFFPLDSPPRGIAIAVGYPQESALAEVRASAVRNYLLFGLVAILAIVASALGARAFIRQPMSELLTTIKRWRSQDLTARVVHTTGRSEFDQLGRAFNSMADELETALKYKDVLLRELNHRVMNTLQTISALFHLQSKSARDPSAAALFEQAIRRLDAVALAYRRMQAIGGFETVEFASYLAELCHELESSMMNKLCVVKADPRLLPAKQVITLSLIVNELVTNAIKHGTHGDDPIVVEFSSAANHCFLAVRNKGILPKAFEVAAKGFGMKMISSMVSQLDGQLEITCVDGTTEFAVTFQPSAPTGTASGLPS